MFRTFRLLVLTAGLSALTVTPGHAVPIVDQSFTSPSNLATVINECCRFIGQTFTAGLTGTLTGVNIDVGPARSDSVLPLLVAIRTVTGSFPSSTVLSSTTLARGGATLSELIVFPQALLAAPLAAETRQAGRVYRIGILGNVPSRSTNLTSIYVNAWEEQAWHIRFWSPARRAASAR